MNVMAKAHELARTVAAHNTEGKKGVYACTLKHALIHFHKEYKAMQAAKADPLQAQIKSTEAFIAKLESALVDHEQVQGFIVVTGEEDMRVCVNAEVSYATNVLNAPVYMRLEDAEYYASRVQNGHGQEGWVVGKYSQLKWEIEQQKEVLRVLKNFA